MNNEPDISHILAQINAGETLAADELFKLLYRDLRELATAKLAHESPGQTLQASALVHEAWLKIANPNNPQEFENRRHFFAAASEAMRRILVDHARRKLRIKHGGDRKRVPFASVNLTGGDKPDELIQIHETLDKLAAEDSKAAALAKLCYFAGLELEQAAEIEGLSRSTAYRHWAFAKAWLKREISSKE